MIITTQNETYRRPDQILVTDKASKRYGWAGRVYTTNFDGYCNDNYVQVAFHADNRVYRYHQSSIRKVKQI